MRRSGRAPVIVVGLAIALIAVGVPAPALALPPVTGPAIQAAVKAGASATLTAGAQWLKVACTLPGGLFTGGIAAFGPQEFTYRVTTQDPTVDRRVHATPQRLTSPIWFVQHVHQSNVAQVRAQAGVSIQGEPGSSGMAGYDSSTPMPNTMSGMPTRWVAMLRRSRW